MGVRFPSVGVSGAVPVLPANPTETLIVTSAPINITLDFAQVFISWFINFVAGTANTQVGLAIRRGAGVTGTRLSASPWVQNVTAGQSFIITGLISDIPGAVAGMQYSLTIFQTGATGAGTMLDSCIAVLSL